MTILPCFANADKFALLFFFLEGHFLILSLSWEGRQAGLSYETASGVLRLLISSYFDRHCHRQGSLVFASDLDNMMTFRLLL